MEIITDKMIDSFYGEYERPERETGECAVCSNCGEEIALGEEVCRLPYWHKSSGELLCLECAGDERVIDSIWNEMSIAEKLELLDMQMEPYEEGII